MRSKNCRHSKLASSLCLVVVFLHTGNAAVPSQPKVNWSPCVKSHSVSPVPSENPFAKV
jgi:hypothetical protein